VGWPKGKPRKGYVKKDKKVGVPWSDLGIDTEPTVPRAKKVLADLSNVQSKGKVAVKADPTDAEPVLHGMVGNGAITEPCPNCMYAYADGGYCPSCGWSRPIIRHEYDTHRGRMW
jgi:hypothetical protein